MLNEVLIIEREGPVAVLTLNRPHVKNALDAALLDALLSAVRAAGEDPAVRAIVLTGAGGAFCSGADLKSAMAEGRDPLVDIDLTLDTYHAVIRAILHAPKPVIAAVDGAAVGFGCDLSLACDLRLASSEAYFQTRFVKIGLMPDGGGTFWLPRLIGLARAMEMMLLGDPVGAPRALEIGLITRVFPPSSLAAEARRLAQQLAKGPPVAYAEIKHAVREGFGGTAENSLRLERAGQLRCLHSSDFLEGVAAWVQKREPEFHGK
jgi:2-(1,2-epoxy-1,2-dihydrophenyl)acetyl-CoA isomerase